MRRLAPHGQCEAGFTLLEIIVTVGIIAILAALALPRLQSAMRTGKDSPGLVDSVAIANALEQYFIDNAKYPTSNANNIMKALRGPYLKLSPTFRNGYDQGYLYLTSLNGKGFYLIDLRGVKQDDSPDVGQQIKIRCTAPSGATEHRTFTVQQGSNAALTTPPSPGPGQPPWVSNTTIDSCVLLNPNPNIKIMTHFR